MGVRKSKACFLVSACFFLDLFFIFDISSWIFFIVRETSYVVALLSQRCTKIYKPILENMNQCQRANTRLT